MRIGVLSLCAALLVLALAGGARSQVVERPADERPKLEPFEPETPVETPLDLPPIPKPRDDGELGAGLAIFVREIRVEGSSVFSKSELDRVTEPWIGREIDSVELLDVTDALTRLYVERGYVSSSAFLPDQDLEAGLLVIGVIEASLADVAIEGNDWYRSSYLRGRLLAAVKAPVNVHEIEEQLQVLLQDPGIRQLRAELRPGLRRGKDLLAVVVEDSHPFGMRIRAANDSPPGVGSVGGHAFVEDRSLLGFGDRLRGWFELTEGLNSQEVRYDVPLNAWGTELNLRGRRTESEVVEDPFDAIDIKSDTWTIGVGFRHPLVRTPNTRVWAGVLGERRRSKTYLLGRRFSFTPGPENGVADVSVLRFTQDFTWRARWDVVAARSTASWGLGVLGATTHGGDVPDGRFVSWLAQAQWAHRFAAEALRGTQLIVRTDFQLASGPLLSLEQIAVGGGRTVRGYRENLLVRDNAVIASAELRIPLIGNLPGGGTLELAPFADLGHAWNDELTPSPKTIASVGVGLRVALWDRVHAHAYWGGRLRKVERTGSNIQDNGFHLAITIRAF